MSDDDRDLDIDSDEEGFGGSGGGGGGQDKRAHHNALERKRRDHIKDSFTGLKDAIPSLQARQGDKCSRAQILKKASEYIAFMRRKNSSHSSDIEDLKRQNQHLENQVSHHNQPQKLKSHVLIQIKSLEKAKSSGHFVQAASLLHPVHNRDENEVGQSHQGVGQSHQGGGGQSHQGGETRSASGSPQPGQSLLLEGQGGPPRKKTKP